MIEVTFISSSDLLTGFTIKGHSGYAGEGSDIVCASVSSAAYMTANTITEVLKQDAKIKLDEAYLELRLSVGSAAVCKDIMQGFKLHITGLAQQYSKYIKVKISEV